MQSAVAIADTSVLRPTQLIAEALIDQHDSSELISKAQRLGLSPDVTEAVVLVCCNRRSRDAYVSPITTPSRG